MCEVEDSNEPLNECVGCYEDGITDLEELILKPWLEAQGLNEQSTVDILGMNVGWQRTRAKGSCVPTTQDILDIMRINGDWKLVFEIKGNLIVIVRYSHDEPTGSVWEIHSRGRRK